MSDEYTDALKSIIAKTQQDKNPPGPSGAGVDHEVRSKRVKTAQRAHYLRKKQSKAAGRGEV